MSKNIVIQEGGVGRQFTADKLKTALVGGGSCNWVPEDEVGLTTLSVTANGTYTAATEGHYGYSQVTVNVAGGAGSTTPGGAGSSIIGTDSDGDTSVVEVDENGEIETTKQVDKIRIGVMPTKTTYQDGEAIDITGMRVMGLTTTGTFLKFIPLEELTVSPATADLSQVSEMEYRKTDGSITAAKFDMREWTDLDTNCVGGTPFKRGLPAVGYEEDESFDNITVPREVYAAVGGEDCSVMITKYNGYTYWALVSIAEGGIEPRLYRAYAANTPFQRGYYWYGGTTSGRLTQNVFVKSWPTNTYAIDGMPNIPSSASDPEGVLYAGFEPVGGTQTITVSWTRPSDGTTLTTTFEIFVASEEQTSSGSIEDNPHDNPTLYYEDVAEAINLATLSGNSTVYFRGETYTMSEAIKLRNSLPHSPTA